MTTSLSKDTFDKSAISTFMCLC